MRLRSWKLVQFAAPLGLIPLFACLGPPVESPKTTVVQNTTVRVDQSLKNQVDLLFMIDNSNSMSPKQVELQNKFPQLIKQLDNFAAQGSPASYHIGVVSSDLGAGNTGAGCAAGGGDGAKLQAAPNTKPSNSVPPPTNCTGFSLSGGVNFLIHDQITGMDNINGGLAVADAFNCIAHVGDQGCGFEHQLESAYRALHDKTITENHDFVRDGAILAVVFVSDEDDCSAPDNTDLFDLTSQANSMYGLLHSFRCTQFGVQCNGMPVPGMATPNPFMGCSSYDLSNGGKLTDLNTYIKFFTQPAALGGVKPDPHDVILVGITAPSDPVGVSIVTPCDTTMAMSCAEITPSCVQPGNPTWHGDPAVRMNAVINSAQNHSLTSICDNDFTSALQKLGDLIISSLGVGCLNAPVANKADGTPDCVVTDVTTKADGTVSSVELPSCAQNNNTPPCWMENNNVDEYNSEQCYLSPQPMPPTCKLPSTCQPVPNAMHIGDTPPPKCANTMADKNLCELVTISVNRGNDATGKPNAAPPGTVSQVSCATIASSM